MIATSCPKMTVDLMCRSFSADAPNMVRSACGSTEYNVVARISAPDGELPSDQGADLQAPKIALSVKGESPHNNDLFGRRPPDSRRRPSSCWHPKPFTTGDSCSAANG